MEGQGKEVDGVVDKGCVRVQIAILFRKKFFLNVPNQRFLGFFNFLCPAKQGRLTTERSWVRIPVGARLFFSSLSGAPSRRCYTTDFPTKMPPTTSACSSASRPTTSQCTTQPHNVLRKPKLLSRSSKIRLFHYLAPDW